MESDKKGSDQKSLGKDKESLESLGEKGPRGGPLFEGKQDEKPSEPLGREGPSGEKKPEKPSEVRLKPVGARRTPLEEKPSEEKLGVTPLEQEGPSGEKKPEKPSEVRLKPVGARRTSLEEKPSEEKSGVTPLEQEGPSGEKKSEEPSVEPFGEKPSVESLGEEKPEEKPAGEPLGREGPVGEERSSGGYSREEIPEEKLEEKPVDEPLGHEEPSGVEKPEIPLEERSPGEEHPEEPSGEGESLQQKPSEVRQEENIPEQVPSEEKPSEDEKVRPKTRAEVQPPPEMPDKKEEEEGSEVGREGGRDVVGKEVGKDTEPGEKISVQPDVKCDIVKRSHGDLDKNTTIPTTTVDKPRTGHSYYEVVISTGEEAGASTFNRGMYIVLEGTKASSGKQYLRKLFSRAATKGATDVLQLEASSDLGDILVATVGNDEPWVEMMKRPWFVDYIAVHNFQSKETMTFPCYHWINTGSWIGLTSRTTIPKDVSENGVLIYHRKSVLEQRRKLYQWMNFPHTMLPSGMDTGLSILPLDEEFDNVKNLNFSEEVQKSHAMQSIMSSKRLKVEHLRDFEALAEAETHHHVRTPLYEAGRWTRDEEFGEQVLNGVNPCLIRKCTSLPENFRVTTEMVQGSLSRGGSLDDEIKNGHVYICDLKILDGLPCREGFFCAAPLCLLYVNGYNKLVPIAIQLKQMQSDDNPVFLPSDSWIDWLLAKMHFQSAFAQLHLLVQHYLCCHFILEAFIVATMRNLPDPHPIFKLLRPHMRTTLSINSRARETLLNDGGLFDQILSIGGEGKNELFRRASGLYNLQWNNIAKDVKERGVDNQDELPGYYYRDDGLKVWDALNQYVQGVVSLYYQSDEDVKHDTELRSWLEDMNTHGSPKRGLGMPNCGIPKEVSSKEELIELCTTVIFTATALHAAVTAPQFRQYSFVPNAPLSMSRSPPSRKGMADIRLLMASLPDEEPAAKGVAISHILSQYASNEAYSGDFPHIAAFNYQWFPEAKAKEMILNLRSNLDSISLEVRERNRSLAEPYNALFPDMIPSSVTI